MTEEAISILEDLNIITREKDTYKVNLGNLLGNYTLGAICFLYYQLTLEPEQVVKIYENVRNDINDDETLFVTLSIAQILGVATFLREKLGIPEEQAKKYKKETIEALIQLLQDIYRRSVITNETAFEFVYKVNQAFRTLYHALYVISKTIVEGE